MLRLLAVLLLVGCATAPPPTLKPQPPQVRCQQPATPRTPPAPREDAWLEEAPEGVRLSQAAVNWIGQVLGLLAKERGLRAIEHTCLDGHEKAGHIRQ
jgi:hypothetical protein